MTTLSLSDEDIAPRREGGLDEIFAIASQIKQVAHAFYWKMKMDIPGRDFLLAIARREGVSGACFL